MKILGRGGKRTFFQVYLLEHRAQRRISKNQFREIWRHSSLSILLNSSEARSPGRLKGRDSMLSFTAAKLIGEQGYHVWPVPMLHLWHRWTTAMLPQGQVPLHSGESIRNLRLVDSLADLERGRGRGCSEWDQFQLPNPLAQALTSLLLSGEVPVGSREGSQEWSPGRRKHEVR